MLFNSLDFAVFLPIVFALYWLIPRQNIRLQNGLIVVASYVFYGWWDWRFLALILCSTIVDYCIGRYMPKVEQARKRKTLLWLSIAVNIGFLGFFKYYNFFVENFVEAFTFFGFNIQANTLNIILPVGISFYTFQTLSYTIDVYRKKLESTKDFIAFSAFVSFFPQLVAGPIERATNLLPQFYKTRLFDYTKAVDGLRQILWGLFKKVVIADTCAQYANDIFNNSGDYSGSTLILGALFFTFQIYGDFSGYSDIAIGTSRLFGFNLKQNFAFPYFSRDIAEFWRRWHISLSTWFRDYVYIPLGGSRGSTAMKVRNVFIIFLVSGFWHGANWTFIIWGALNALYFLPVLLTHKNRRYLDVVASGKMLPSFKEFLAIAITFALTVFAWIFFRAENIDHALSYISGMVSGLDDYANYYKSYRYVYNLGLPFLILMLGFMAIEWLGRGQQYALETLGLNWNKSLRWALYLVIAIGILLFSGSKQEFIYFQF